MKEALMKYASSKNGGGEDKGGGGDYAFDEYWSAVKKGDKKAAAESLKAFIYECLMEHEEQGPALVIGFGGKKG